MNLKKYLSYLVPINEKKIVTPFHTLELNWHNGRLLLDSQKANYSYGNLHQVFVRVFRDSQLQIAPTDKVLLLGLGGGSVIDILEKKYAFKGPITAVDIDPAVIDLYQHLFSSHHQSQINLVEADALNFIQHDTSNYDLIVVDLFLDLDLPQFIKTPAFYKDIKKLVAPNGVVYLNTIRNEGEKELDMTLFYPTFLQVESYAYFNLNKVYTLK